MRLDKFLKVSRLIKRRTVAKEVSESARVFVNDKPAKPAKEIKVGDRISVEYYNKTLTVEVLVVPTGAVRIEETKDLYKIIEEKQHN